MRYVDAWLNSITMYRLVMYGLAAIAVWGIVLNGWTYIPSLIILVLTCYFTNYILAKIFKAPINAESATITALILFLLLSPKNIWHLLLAAVIAMTSKYILAMHKKHIFNPAAIAAVILSLLGVNIAWWVDGRSMLPIVIIVGLLVVRKLRRFPLSLTMLVVGFLLTRQPQVFLATIMLTEPLTTPPTRFLQICYGLLVGLLLAVAPPELALVIGNIFAYLVSFKYRLALSLKGRKELAPGIWELTFEPDRSVDFAAGQYLEWTLAQDKTDTRGNRRYFTICSSPTEKDLRVAIKIPPEKSSSFKSELLRLRLGSVIWAGQLMGDFVLPEDKAKKLVWIAGGIGVTPFRSQAKYLFDTKQKRNIVMFYMASDATQFVYKDVFVQAGIKTHYLTTRLQATDLSNYKDRFFYLSGPNAMVESYKQLLSSLKVPLSHIVTDYFPGY